MKAPIPIPTPIPIRVGNVVFVKLHIPYVKLLFMAEMFGLRLLTKATVDDDAASDEISKWPMWKCFGYDTDLFPRKHGIHYKGIFKVILIGRLEGFRVARYWLLVFTEEQPRFSDSLIRTTNCSFG